MKKKDLEALRAGTMKFPEFAEKTRRDWERIADALIARWQPGPEVDREDVVQELLMAVSVFIGRFEPGRSELHDYIVFNAVDKAKKWLVSCRGKGNREEGLIPYPLDDLSDFATAWADSRAPSQHRVVETMQRLRLLGPAADALLQAEGRIQTAVTILRERTGRSLAQSIRDVRRVAKVLSPA